MMKELNTRMMKNSDERDTQEQISEISAHFFYRRYVKRSFDIVLSGLGIIVLAVPMLIVAFLIKITSPGPVFFCQTRYGRDSRPFTLVKFRSMAVDAPEKANKDFSKEAMAHYVTPLGRFLRKSSIDELPQLFNVFVGQMSLIGPRPLAKTDNHVLELRRANGADRVRPGITGMAQVNGRNEVSDDDKAAFDASYARNYSFMVDVKLIIDSVIVVVSQRGINKKND
ncbi:sugar transferase [Lacticaseibacillus sp. 866-1]|uniref:sugar transferase n=1 Tax=Lacticaseibacillus sp. 866-1 TaxID=2799576 RepID=UPI001EF2221F|nr:sugar transferase [Lacticaseibacillus sp. 866-1]